MHFTDLPTLNAALNAISTALLVAGYRFIRRQQRTAHRNCMLAALTTSAAFLASYLYYHYRMQQEFGEAHTRFVDPAWFRPVYLVILFTHLVGAIVIVPLVVWTVIAAARGRFDAHRRVARWTWPLWIYVSVTGVLIYLLLYHIFPQTRT